MNISVCMATYNGAPYIREQIASILPQIGPGDGIIMVDDASSDDTIDIVESFCDSRIRIIRNERNLGVIRSFERALREAQGEIVFLSDQDDIWRKDKVAKVKQMFLNNADLTLVLSDVSIVDASGSILADSWLKTGKFHAGVLHNLIRNRYLGCAMAFRRALLEHCLPFPEDTPMHDMWIGMVNQIVGKIGFTPEPLMSYRRHGRNHTTGRHASLSQMIRWRFALVKNLACFYLRSRSVEAAKLGAAIR